MVYRFHSSSAVCGPTRIALDNGETRAASNSQRMGRLTAVIQPETHRNLASGQQPLIHGRPGKPEGTTADNVRVLATPHNVRDTAASPVERRDSFAQLTEILSPSASSSITPVPARAVRKLYTVVASRSQLRRLSSKQLTRLLSLMGTISLPPPRATCIYFSNLVKHIEESSFREFWPFVLEVARDKEALGLHLDGTDRYWIMRAQLAKVVVAEGEILRSGAFTTNLACCPWLIPRNIGDSRLHALSVAHEQYLRIRRHSPDPSVHLPYFQTLLSLGSSQHIATLVRCLCRVLELIPNPHSSFFDILCHVLLKHGHSLPPEMKQDVLSMISTRLTNFNFVSAPSQDSGPPSANKAFDNASKRYKQAAALGISDLRSALGMAIFPFSSPKEAPWDVRQWANGQAAKTFSPAVAWERRWDNLILFAISRMPDVPVVEFLPATTEGPDSSTASWRAVFVLATLQDTLATMNPTSLQAAQVGIRNIVRPLWRMWKAENASVVASVIAATFFRAAEKTLDVPLKEGCFRYCEERGLFNTRDGAILSEELQTRDLFVACILATISCDKGTWPEVFSALAPLLPSMEVRDGIVEQLLWHCIPYNVEDALELYVFSRRNSVKLSMEVIHALSISLASSRVLNVALPFLYHPQFTRSQVEELLGNILRVFQLEKRRHIDQPLADKLGQVMWKLYAHERPTQRFKYPIRFFFSIMIASGQPSQALSIVNAIHRQAPAFFTTRFFLRIMRTLVRHRKLRMAARLLRLVPQTHMRASDDFRRKLTYSLDRAGADKVARAVYRTGIRRKGWRTTRETLQRLVAFRSRDPSSRRSLQFMPTVARNPSNGPAIKYAVSVLVRARRSFAARQLFARSHHLLDQKTKTSVGNIILHGPLLRLELRNGRLVRHVLRAKELLESTCAFSPDRTTMNIILKALLRWRVVFDPPKIKALFDHIIRSGYPASLRWRHQHNVPFGTPALASSHAFSLPPLRSAISFERHVRPMYKMFIKAFYLRHDIRAAKMIVGILKEEEHAATQKREARDRARRDGLAKKPLRDTI
jgi:hypothetical protein